MAKPTPVPVGFRTVTPYLSVSGGVRALEFYRKAFGAKEIASAREQTPDGKLIHSRFKIGNSLIMLSDSFEPPASGRRESPVTLHIYARDIDKMWASAVAAGAKVVMPLDDQFWGERYGQLEDPFGHKWSLSMRVKMDKKEMERKRKEAMKMFSEPGN